MQLDRKHLKQRIRTYRNKLAKDFDDLFDFGLFTYCLIFSAGCALVVAMQIADTLAHS